MAEEQRCMTCGVRERFEGIKVARRLTAKDMQGEDGFKCSTCLRHPAAPRFGFLWKLRGVAQGDHWEPRSDAKEGKP